MFTTIESACEAAAKYARTHAQGESMVTTACDDGTYSMASANGRLFISVGYRMLCWTGKRGSSVAFMDQPGAYGFYPS